MRLVPDLEVSWQRNFNGKYASFQLTPVSIHIQFNPKRDQGCCLHGVTVTVCKDCICIKSWRLFFSGAIVVPGRRLSGNTQGGKGKLKIKSFLENISELRVLRHKR